MAQLGPSDYRSTQTNSGRLHEQSDGIMDQVTDTARDFGERASSMAGELGDAIKHRPYTTLAIAAGMAFLVGALWKLGHQRPQTRFEVLRDQMPTIPSLESLLPRRWR
jgi:hypothetical protein